MRNRFIPFLLLLTLTGLAIVVSAQTEGVKASIVPGDVVSITETKIVIKTKDGDLDVVLNDKTEFKKLPPDLKLSAAVGALKSDISEGDKVVASGFFSQDKKSLSTRTVYLVSKSELAQKQAKDSERWTTRGISGRVASVNTATNQITIEVRGLMSTTNVTVSPKTDAQFKRYRQDSVKYSEALESSIAEIKPGDTFRAVGERGTDGATFTAEEVLTGAFQTIAGAVKSIDAEKNEIVIADGRTKKDVIVSLASFSVLKKFPEEMAMRMTQFGGGSGQGGMRPAGGQPGGQPGAGQGGERPAGGQPGQGAAGGGRQFGGPRGGIDDIFERLPVIAITDLKPGDVIAVSSSKNGSEKITAIKVLAGVGPFLAVAQAQAAAGRGGRGQGGGYSIPGLDGFDFGN